MEGGLDDLDCHEKGKKKTAFFLTMSALDLDNPGLNPGSVQP